MFKTLRNLAAALFVVLATCAQWHLREQSNRHYSSGQTYDPVYSLPPPALLKWMSLGQREALADLLWVRGLLYLGEETAHQQPARDVFRYARAVTSLDPFFAAAYRIFPFATISVPGLSLDETVERAREAAAFMEEGVRSLPHDGELAWDTGSVYAYSIAPHLADKEAYAAAKRRGLEHMQTGVLLGAGPPWAGLANASTLIRLGQTEQAIRHLQELHAITSDPTVRKGIEAQLTRLQSEAFMEGFRHSVLEVEAARERDFPYVDETLYLLLGPRPPFDGVRLLAQGFDPAVGMVTDDAPKSDDAPVDHSAE